jgi:FkbM family methyltransferase
MNKTLKRITSRLPRRYQQELKRIRFGYQIRKGTFKTDEQEFGMLESWVGKGDWVLDIGANVGHYTSRLSEIVGETGRVLAFEPVPETFELLAANVARLPLRNVTLLNIAASESTNVLGMNVPKFDSGLENYYSAQLTHETAEFRVLCAPIDSLGFLPCPPSDTSARRIRLAKIDVEGHELSVVKGMQRLLGRDHLILIVEGDSPEVASYLAAFGYSARKIEGSPNTIFSCL